MKSGITPLSKNRRPVSKRNDFYKHRLALRAGKVFLKQKDGYYTDLKVSVAMLQKIIHTVESLFTGKERKLLTA